MNICMEFCVLMASCITNHTKYKDISPDSCNRLHYIFSKWPPPKTQNCYNFGLHLNICMKFGVLMASYVTNDTKCQDISPGSCDSPHSKFSKWPPLKTYNCHNFGLQVNICMKICLLVTSCVTNHKNVRIHQLVLVIAAIKNFQNGRQWKLKILACLSCVTYSVVQWGNRCIPL